MTSLTEPSAGELGRVEPAEFREFMRSWATGVTVVTGLLDEHPAGCTVNAFTSVSLVPPLLLVSLAEHSRTLAAIRQRATFAVNLLSWRQRRLAAQFAAPDRDRFGGVAHRPVHGVPVLDRAMAVTVCELAQLVPVADHVLVIGRPLWCQRSEGAEPVIFLGGRYQRSAAGESGAG
jgi:flavin reductase (DIM6/NTAB) family NADH-FMN oxidoreductase RutF